VHEGPHSISPRWKNAEGLKAGYVVSNEPGYYEDGNFGIRIENLLEIDYVNPEDKDRPEDPMKKKFLKFKKLTMIPIQTNLINMALLSDEEKRWIDQYHAEVMEKVGSRLEPGSAAYAWLARSCSKIQR
jgi:Xaa-Pro aminopeptidase